MGLIIIIVVLTSVLLGIFYILNEIGNGKYKMKNTNSIIQEESIKKFQKEYPEKDIQDLKIEIEKISDMLLDNQKSNRYTIKIQEKAKKDLRLDPFRDLIADDVEICKYNKNKLKAKVNYIIGNIEYILIMDMRIVKKGRAFLERYKILKRNIIENT